MELAVRKLQRQLIKAGLKGKRATADKFVLIDDSNIEEQN